MKYDISIHLDQTIDLRVLMDKLDDWIFSNKGNLPFDFSEPTDPITVLHHYYDGEEIYDSGSSDKNIYDIILNPLSEHIVCWKGASSYGLGRDKIYMCQNLKKVSGLAMFLGPKTKEMEEELEFLQEIKVDILEIP